MDQPQPQAWKQQRLVELGFGTPDWLRFVPVNFEADSWWERLLDNGFDSNRPAVVASLGVSMYLTGETTADLERLITFEIKKLPGIARTHTVIALSSPKETTRLPLDLVRHPGVD